MRALLAVLVILVGFAPSLPGQVQAPAGPKVQLTFEADGKVSLIANGATLREILAEWTRKGGTPFVGAERLSGGPLSLQYDHRPETEVVGSLFRNAAGVIMAPRLEGSTGASQLEVVYVLATSSPTSSAGYTTPTYNVTQQPVISSAGAPDTEIPPAAPGRTGEPPQGSPAAPSAPPRPTGVSGVAVQVIAVPTPGTTPTPTPTPTPPATGRGRGGGGGSR